MSEFLKPMFYLRVRTEFSPLIAFIFFIASRKKPPAIVFHSTCLQAIVAFGNLNNYYQAESWMLIS